VLLGLNTPAPPDQIPPLAPVTIPFRIVFGLCAQLVSLAPAFAEIGTLNAVTVTEAVAGGQPEASESTTV